MLLGNGSVLHKLPLKFYGGSTTSVEPQLVNNFDKSGPRRNRILIDQRTTALNLFAIPTGYYAQSAWFLPQKLGEISSHERARLTVSQSGLAVGGITTAGTATLSITPADLIGQLISSGDGTAAMSISVANLVLTGSVSGTGSSLFTITSDTPILGALAGGYGVATMTFNGTLSPYAIGSMTGNTVSGGVLTEASILAAMNASPPYVNIKKVNDVTVNGIGTSGNPWGS
jgi:hypothetical protein